MAEDKDFLDEVADVVGLPEEVKCDNILRWNGSRLYVTEEVYRNGHRSRERKRDVTREVADRLSRILKASRL
jgi:hypothetical protein